MPTQWMIPSREPRRTGRAMRTGSRSVTVGLGGGGTGGQGPRKKVPCRWLHIPVDEDPKLLRAPNHFHLGQTSPVGSDI